MLTRQEFAKRIKTKYPEYKDINDDILVEKIVNKYPEYRAEVDMKPIGTWIGKPQPGSRPFTPEEQQKAQSQWEAQNIPMRPEDYMEAAAVGLARGGVPGLGYMATKDNYAAKRLPIATMAGELAGSIPTMGLAGKMLPQAATIPQALAKGGAIGAGYSAAYEAPQDKPLQEKALTVGLSTALGAVIETLPILQKMREGKQLTDAEVKKLAGSLPQQGYEGVFLPEQQKMLPPGTGQRFTAMPRQLGQPAEVPAPFGTVPGAPAYEQYAVKFRRNETPAGIIIEQAKTLPDTPRVQPAVIQNAEPSINMVEVARAPYSTVTEQIKTNPSAPGTISKMVNYAKRIFSRTGGASEAVDKANDFRLFNAKADLFRSSKNAMATQEYLKKNPGMTEPLYNYLTGQSAVELLPTELRPLAQSMRQDVDNLSKIFLENGVPSDNLRVVINKNLGRYLARSYKLFESDSYANALLKAIDDPTAKLRPKVDAVVNYLKKDKLFGQMADDEIRGYLKSIVDKTEFTFPSYLGGSKQTTIPQNHFIKRLNMPKEFREFYGEIKDPVWNYVNTMGNMTKVAYNSKFLNDISKLPNMLSAAPTRTHTFQLPTGKSWGAMAGKYVTPDVGQYLDELMSPKTNPVSKMIDSFIINPFKWSKTVGNIPTHGRNFFGNTSFSMLADNNILNPANTKYYTQAIKTLATKNKGNADEWEKLIRLGIVDNQFFGGEIPKMMTELINDPIEYSMKDAITKKAGKLLTPGKKIINALGELYNAEDQVYRLSAFYKYVANGMTPEQAALKVDRYFTNYAKAAPVVKALRKYPLLGPFISFRAETARIYKNAIEDAIVGKNPKQAMAVMATILAPYALKEAASRIFNVDKSEVDKLEKVMPEYRRNAQMVYWRDGKGKLNAFDLTYILPAGDYIQAFNGIRKGDMSFANQFFLDSPLADTYAAIKYGVDSQGKDIRNKLDPMDRQISDTLKTLIPSLYIPGFMPIPSARGLKAGYLEASPLSGYQGKALIEAISGKKNKYGIQRSVPQELAGMTGFRTWKVEPETVVTSYKAAQKAAYNDELQKLRNWMKQNMNVPQSIKDEQINDTKRRIEVIKRNIEFANSIKIKTLEPSTPGNFWMMEEEPEETTQGAEE